MRSKVFWHILLAFSSLPTWPIINVRINSPSLSQKYSKYLHYVHFIFGPQKSLFPNKLEIQQLTNAELLLFGQLRFDKVSSFQSKTVWRRYSSVGSKKCTKNKLSILFQSILKQFVHENLDIGLELCASYNSDAFDHFWPAHSAQLGTWD